MRWQQFQLKAFLCFPKYISHVFFTCVLANNLRRLLYHQLDYPLYSFIRITSENNL